MHNNTRNYNTRCLVRWEFQSFLEETKSAFEHSKSTFNCNSCATVKNSAYILNLQNAYGMKLCIFFPKVDPERSLLSLQLPGRIEISRNTISDQTLPEPPTMS
eukprot:TRINITY_DN4370_c0_g1_i2.p1 TRINITY_DN4370_c0_g1~~TRINITY_DN4370_c0_g1_i2.p1  ORF type:complete len:103 (+),score=7.97 TRINITY_DN4370_c0_g1_i2:239-547(+)